MSRLTARRTRLALAAVALVLTVAYLLVPHWSTQYAAALVTFTVWMLWFVLTVVDLLDEPGVGG